MTTNQPNSDESNSDITNLSRLNTDSAAAATVTANQLNPDFEYKVKLVEERDRLLDQKSELQDKIS